SEVLPPSVPRSVIVPFDHTNACHTSSPANIDVPATSPESFKTPVPGSKKLGSPGTESVAPRLPTSCIVPFFQRKGGTVGLPVVSFGVAFVKDSPTICPLWFIPQAAASLPPNSPRSCMKPFCHRNALACVAAGKENVITCAKSGFSSMAFSATPTTWPRLFAAKPILEFPPKVPKSTMLRSRFQSTARSCGKSVRGSIKPFSENPVISPLSVIQTGALLFTPGSAPKSVATPLVSRTAPCQIKQSI